MEAANMNPDSLKEWQGFDGSNDGDGLMIKDKTNQTKVQHIPTV
jgi:hypothetical protein